MQVATTIDGDTGMVVKRLSVPVGLEELMESLTKQVLMKKPKDLFAFASEHFAHLVAIREKLNANDGELQNSAETKQLKVKSVTSGTRFNKLPTPIVYTNSKGSQAITTPKAFQSEEKKKTRFNQQSLIKDTSPRRGVATQKERAKWKKQPSGQKEETAPVKKTPREIREAYTFRRDNSKNRSRDRTRQDDRKEEKSKLQKSSSDSSSPVKETRESRTRREPAKKQNGTTPRITPRTKSTDSSSSGTISVHGKGISKSTEKLSKASKGKTVAKVAPIAAVSGAAVAGGVALARKGKKSSKNSQENKNSKDSDSLESPSKTLDSTVGSESENLSDRSDKSKTSQTSEKTINMNSENGTNLENEETEKKKVTVASDADEKESVSGSFASDVVIGTTMSDDISENNDITETGALSESITGEDDKEEEKNDEETKLETIPEDGKEMKSLEPDVQTSVEIKDSEADKPDQNLKESEDTKEEVEITDDSKEKFDQLNIGKDSIETTDETVEDKHANTDIKEDNKENIIDNNITDAESVKSKIESHGDNVSDKKEENGASEGTEEEEQKIVDEPFTVHGKPMTIPEKELCTVVDNEETGDSHHSNLENKDADITDFKHAGEVVEEPQQAVKELVNEEHDNFTDKVVADIKNDTKDNGSENNTAVDDINTEIPDEVNKNILENVPKIITTGEETEANEFKLAGEVVVDELDALTSMQHKEVKADDETAEKVIKSPEINTLKEAGKVVEMEHHTLENIENDTQDTENISESNGADSNRIKDVKELVEKDIDELKTIDKDIHESKEDLKHAGEIVEDQLRELKEMNQNEDHNKSNKTADTDNIVENTETKSEENTDNMENPKEDDEEQLSGNIHSSYSAPNLETSHVDDKQESPGDENAGFSEDQSKDYLPAKIDDAGPLSIEDVSKFLNEEKQKQDQETGHIENSTTDSHTKRPTTSAVFGGDVEAPPPKEEALALHVPTVPSALTQLAESGSEAEMNNELAATKIQSVWRGHNTRKQAGKQIKKQVENEEENSVGVETQLDEKDNHYLDSEEKAKAATVIQAFLKGHLVRNHIKLAKKESAEKFTTIGKLDSIKDDEEEKLANAATVIQSFMRGHLVRSKNNKTKQNQEDVASNENVEKQEDDETTQSKRLQNNHEEKDTDIETEENLETSIEDKQDSLNTNNDADNDKENADDENEALQIKEFNDNKVELTTVDRIVKHEDSEKEDGHETQSQDSMKQQTIDEIKANENENGLNDTNEDVYTKLSDSIDKEIHEVLEKLESVSVPDDDPDYHSRRKRSLEFKLEDDYNCVDEEIEAAVAQHMAKQIDNDVQLDLHDIQEENEDAEESNSAHAHSSLPESSSESKPKLVSESTSISNPDSDNKDESKDDGHNLGEAFSDNPIAMTRSFVDNEKVNYVESPKTSPRDEDKKHDKSKDGDSDKGKLAGAIGVVGGFIAAKTSDLKNLLSPRSKSSKKKPVEDVKNEVTEETQDNDKPTESVRIKLKDTPHNSEDFSEINSDAHDGVTGDLENKEFDTGTEADGKELNHSEKEDNVHQAIDDEAIVNKTENEIPEKLEEHQDSEIKPEEDLMTKAKAFVDYEKKNYITSPRGTQDNESDIKEDAKEDNAEEDLMAKAKAFVDYEKENYVTSLRESSNIDSKVLAGTIGAVGGLIASQTNNLKTLLSSGSTSLEEAKESLGKLDDDVVEMIENVAESADVTINSKIAQLKEEVDETKDTAKKASEKLENDVENAKIDIENKIDATFEESINAVDNTISDIASATEQGQRNIEEYVEDAGKTVDSKVTDMSKNLKKTSEDLKKQVEEKIDIAENNIKENLQSISDKFDDKLETTDTLLEEINDDVEKKVTDKINALEEDVAIIKDNIKDTSANAADRINKTTDDIKADIVKLSNETDDTTTHAGDDLKLSVADISKEGHKAKQEINDAVKDLEKENEEILESVEKVSDKISDSNLVADAENVAEEAKSDVKENIHYLADNIAEIRNDLGEEVDKIEDKVTGAAENLEDTIANAEHDVQENITSLGDDIEDRSHSVIDKINDSIESAKYSISNAIEGAENAVDESKNAINNSTKSVEEHVSNIKNGMEESVKQTGEQIQSELNNIAENIDNTASGAEIDIRNNLQESQQILSEKIDKITERSDNLLTETEDNIKDHLKDVQSKIDETTDEVTEKVDVLNDDLEHLKDSVNEIESNNTDHLNNIDKHVDHIVLEAAEVASEVGKDVKNKLEEDTQELIDEVDKLTEKTEGTIEANFHNIQNKIEGTNERASENDMKTELEEDKQEFSEKVNNVTERADDVIETIKDNLKNETDKTLEDDAEHVNDSVKEVGDNIKADSNNITENVEIAAMKMKDIVSDVDNIREIKLSDKHQELSQEVDKLTEKTDNVEENIEDTIKDHLNDIKHEIDESSKSVNGEVNNLKKNAEQLENDIKNAINNENNSDENLADAKSPVDHEKDNEVTSSLKDSKDVSDKHSDTSESSKIGSNVLAGAIGAVGGLIASQGNKLKSLLTPGSKSKESGQVVMDNIEESKEELNKNVDKLSEAAKTDISKSENDIKDNLQDIKKQSEEVKDEQNIKLNNLKNKGERLGNDIESGLIKTDDDIDKPMTDFKSTDSNKIEENDVTIKRNDLNDHMTNVKNDINDETENKMEDDLENVSNETKETTDNIEESSKTPETNAEKHIKKSIGDTSRNVSNVVADVDDTNDNLEHSKDHASKEEDDTNDNISENKDELVKATDDFKSDIVEEKREEEPNEEIKKKSDTIMGNGNDKPDSINDNLSKVFLKTENEISNNSQNVSDEAIETTDNIEESTKTVESNAEQNIKKKIADNSKNVSDVVGKVDDTKHNLDNATDHVSKEDDSIKQSISENNNEFVKDSGGCKSDIVDGICEVEPNKEIKKKSDTIMRNDNDEPDKVNENLSNDILKTENEIGNNSQNVSDEVKETTENIKESSKTVESNAEQDIKENIADNSKNVSDVVGEVDDTKHNLDNATDHVSEEDDNIKHTISENNDELVEATDCGKSDIVDGKSEIKENQRKEDITNEIDNIKEDMESLKTVHDSSGTTDHVNESKKNTEKLNYLEDEIDSIYEINAEDKTESSRRGKRDTNDQLNNSNEETDAKTSASNETTDVTSKPSTEDTIIEDPDTITDDDVKQETVTSESDTHDNDNDKSEKTDNIPETQNASKTLQSPTLEETIKDFKDAIQNEIDDAEEIAEKEPHSLEHDLTASLSSDQLLERLLTAKSLEDEEPPAEMSEQPIVEEPESDEDKPENHHVDILIIDDNYTSPIEIIDEEDGEEVEKHTDDESEDHSESQQLIHEIKTELNNIKAIIEEEDDTNAETGYNVHLAEDENKAHEDEAEALKTDEKEKDDHDILIVEVTDDNENEKHVNKDKDDVEVIDVKYDDNKKDTLDAYSNVGRLISHDSSTSLDSLATVVLTEDLNKFREDRKKEEDIQHDNHDTDNKSNDKTEEKTIKLEKKTDKSTPKNQENSIDEIYNATNKTEEIIALDENANQDDVIIIDATKLNSKNEDDIKFLTGFVNAATKIQSAFRGFRVRNLKPDKINKPKDEDLSKNDRDDKNVRNEVEENHTEADNKKDNVTTEIPIQEDSKELAEKEKEEGPQRKLRNPTLGQFLKAMSTSAQNDEQNPIENTTKNEDPSEPGQESTPTPSPKIEEHQRDNDLEGLPGTPSPEPFYLHDPGTQIDNPISTAIKLTSNVPKEGNVGLLHSGEFHDSIPFTFATSDINKKSENILKATDAQMAQDVKDTKATPPAGAERPVTTSAAASCTTASVVDVACSTPTDSLSASTTTPHPIASSSAAGDYGASVTFAQLSHGDARRSHQGDIEGNGSESPANEAQTNSEENNQQENQGEPTEEEETLDEGNNEEGLDSIERAGHVLGSSIGEGDKIGNKTAPESAKPVVDMDPRRKNNSTIIERNAESQAATKIQASFRGYQVRKQMQKPKIGSDIMSPKRNARRKTSGGRAPDSKKLKDDIDIEDKSATKIQAGIRGFLVRRRNQKKRDNEEI